MKNLKGLDTPVKRAALALAVATLVQAGPALALGWRNINGTATAVAADVVFGYDPVGNTTWYLTSNNTGLNWDDAKSWAAGLTVGMFSDWSLPASDTCRAYNCTDSVMGKLYYTVLNNPARGPLMNTAPFKNLQSYSYWSGTESATSHFDAWSFNTSSGFQRATAKFSDLYALAVRPGDLVAVPEPGMVALLLSGLAGAMVMRRRPVKS